MDNMNADQVADAMANIVLGQSAPAPADAPAQPEAAEAPVEATEQPQVEEQQEETIEIDPDAELFEMELDENGQKVSKKLSLREFQKGYLRQADYTRKTQDLAKQRSEVQEVLRQATDKASKEYAQKLDMLQEAMVKTLAPELANVDWNKLATEDPFEYVRLSNRQRQIAESMQAITAEKSSLEARTRTEEQQKKAERWQKTLEVLQQDIPDWSQPVVQKIVKAAKDAGADEAQVNALDEGWIIKLAHKAALYDELNAKRPEVEKKVALVTKTLKPGQKVTPTKADDNLNRWKKSGGKLNADGAALFDKFI